MATDAQDLIAAGLTDAELLRMMAVAKKATPMLAASEPEIPEGESLKDGVKRILLGEGVAALKNRRIAECVISAMLGAGELLRGDDRQGRYLHKETHTLYTLASQEFGVMLRERTGLGETEDAYKFTLGQIKDLAFKQPVIPVHTMVYYNPETGEHRFCMGGARIWKRMRGGKPEQVWNGDDRILFHMNDRADETEIDFTTTGEIAWLQSVMRLGQHGELTREDQLTLVLVWTVSIMFPRKMRLILLVLGLPYSGKTSLLRLIVKTLFGRNADVTSMPAKEDGANAQLSNSDVAAWDNCDDWVAWLKVMIEVYVTGSAGTSVRTLYQTNEQTTIVPRAIIMMCAVSGTIKQEAFASRMLLSMRSRQTKDRSSARLSY